MCADLLGKTSQKYYVVYSTTENVFAPCNLFRALSLSIICHLNSILALEEIIVAHFLPFFVFLVGVSLSWPPRPATVSFSALCDCS